MEIEEGREDRPVSQPTHEFYDVSYERPSVQRILLEASVYVLASWLRLPG
jgi:hypothetical protein